jgi:hypothetical protein
MTAERDRIRGRRERATEVYLEPLQGPPCPVCHRDDGTHVRGCALPAYLADWKRIHQEHGNRVWEALVGD